MSALVERERVRLRRTLYWLDATQKPESMRQFAVESEDAERRGIAYRFAILHRHVIAGIASVEDCLSEHARVGYWIGEAYEGQGVATDCVKTLVRLRFLSSI